MHSGSGSSRLGDIMQGLHHPKSSRRERAIEDTLQGGIRDEEVIDALIQLSQSDPNTFVRRSAAHAVTVLSAPEPLPLGKAHSISGGEVANTPVPSEPTQPLPSKSEVDRILETLRGEYSRRRERAIEQIGARQVRDELILNELRNLALNDPAKYVRTAAEDVLHSLTGEAISPRVAARSTSAPGGAARKWCCAKCALEMSHSPVFNHCPRCNTATIVSRLGSEPGPLVEDPKEILCFAVASTTSLRHQPDPAAETLYQVGAGDLFGIIALEEDWCKIALPANEVGYIARRCGFEVGLGLGEVTSPFGYVREGQDSSQSSPVYVQQSSGELIKVHELTREDRLPVVQESADAFRVQLVNRLRGWVNKANVIRTARPDSLPQEVSFDWGSALGIAAIVGLGIVGSALAGDTQEDRIRRGVAKGLRDRGY